MSALRIAHRGLRHRGAPENSFAALQCAQDAAWDGSEFDIHVSSEGIPFVFHDDTLQRLCGVEQAIYDCAASYLDTLTLAATLEPIPRYDAVLARFCARQYLYSEIKIPAVYWHDAAWVHRQVQQVLSTFAPYRSQYRGWIASFHALAVADIVAAYPDLALSICDTQAEFDQHYGRFGATIPYALSHRHRIDHPGVPIERILFWDIDAQLALPAQARAHLWDA